MNRLKEIEGELLDIQSRMDGFSEEIRVSQSNLTNIKASMSENRLPEKLFKKYLEAKKIYVDDINTATSKSRSLKLTRTKLCNEYESIKRDVKPLQVDSLKNDLELLKDKYFKFYRDKTRISGMRKMAQDFVIDVDRIIKKN